MRLLAGVFAFLCVWCTSAASAQTPGLFRDPLTLLPEEDTSLRRRGWPLWNWEPEEDWVDRLRKSPPKIVAVFLRWSATAPRISDFDLMVCLDRRLESRERDFGPKALSYLMSMEVRFSDGTTASTVFGPRFLGRGFDEAGRCASIEELHPSFRFTRSFSAEVDLRFRASRIKDVLVTVSRKTEYGQEVVTQKDTFTPGFYIRPTRTSEKGEVNVTREFIAGRVKGEALRSTQKCSNIVSIDTISPPEEGDRSEYAQGFAAGWKLAADFLTSDQRCNEFPRIFEISEVGIANAIRAIRTCPPERFGQVAIGANCVRFDK